MDQGSWQKRKRLETPATATSAQQLRNQKANHASHLMTNEAIKFLIALYAMPTVLQA